MDRFRGICYNESIVKGGLHILFERERKRSAGTAHDAVDEDGGVSKDSADASGVQ